MTNTPEKTIHFNPIKIRRLSIPFDISIRTRAYTRADSLPATTREKRKKKQCVPAYRICFASQEAAEWGSYLSPCAAHFALILLVNNTKQQLALFKFIAHSSMHDDRTQNHVTTTDL